MGNHTKKQRFIKAVLLTHRWLGLLLSCLFVMWCLSGFVMMYRDFPSFSRMDNLRYKPPVQAGTVQMPKAVFNTVPADSIASVQMETVLNSTMVNITHRNGRYYCFDAGAGGRLRVFDTADAVKIVQSYFGDSIRIKTTESITALDQWIPRTRFMPHFPIHKVTLDDGAHTVCYVSSQTGEILQKLDRAGKIWAWLGAIPHWIYFKNLRINTSAWRAVVITISSVGVVFSAAGIVLGIQRAVLARRRKKEFTPYKKRWFRWHHYLGFVFGIFIFSWILSGLFSMNPLKWSPEDDISGEERMIWKGKQPDMNLADSFFIQNSLAVFQQKGPVKELAFRYFNSRLYLVAAYAGNSSCAIEAGSNTTIPTAYTKDDFSSMVQQMNPAHQITAATVLNDYDSYYYNKHRTLPLPVYRYEMNDPAKTCYYVNPATVSVVKKTVTRNRFNRWIYNGLHSLDYPFLFFKRPLWDITVIILLLGCTLLSITGCRLMLKRLRRKFK